MGIRATGAVRQALALARAPVSVGAVERGTAHDARCDSLKRSTGYSMSSGRETFLLTELAPPPLTHPAPRAMSALARVASAGEERVALDAVLRATDAWDQLPIAQRPDAYRSVPRRLGGRGRAGLREHARAGRPRARARRPKTSQVGLARRGRERRRSAAPNPSLGGLGQLDSYRHAFIGAAPPTWVPLVEVLDRDHGLGPPAGYGSTGVGIDQAKLAMRNQTLRKLAVDAFVTGGLLSRSIVDTLDALSLTSRAPGRSRAPSRSTSPSSSSLAPQRRSTPASSSS